MKRLISHVRLLFNIQLVHLFSNTFETARYNMIIHVIVFLVLLLLFKHNKIHLSSIFPLRKDAEKLFIYFILFYFIVFFFVFFLHTMHRLILFLGWRIQVMTLTSP